MIEFALTKTLHGASGPLVLDVQACIADGSTVALHGPSGAGKTTLLRLLAGLSAPDSGRIVIAGETWFDAARRIDLPPQKRAIGFVFQDYALFPHFSVRQNIAYAVHRSQRQWVDELLELTGLSALQHRLPAALSGGQKQRVALARAIARRPTLLLLDEPLSALDTDMRAQLQDTLIRLQRRWGFTILLVSHDAGEIFKLAQRVLRLDGGRLVDAGTPATAFLQQRHAGKLSVRAQVLDIRREDVVHVVSLLIGQDIVEAIASDDEAAALRGQDVVTVSVKAFSLTFSK
ncbi:MAG TPA: ATP-binding cassette domain-containing protein [Noviherbaspirillum sp.]|nr:ATP-binding cassette domain-containing protein [Noviherbaspirillum sp.]